MLGASLVSRNYLDFYPTWQSLVVESTFHASGSLWTSQHPSDADTCTFQFSRSGWAASPRHVATFMPHLSAGVSDGRLSCVRAGVWVQTLCGLMGLRVCLNTPLCLDALGLGAQSQNPGFSFPWYFESPGPVSSYFQSSWGRIEWFSFLYASSFWGGKLSLLCLVRGGEYFSYSSPWCLWPLSNRDLSLFKKIYLFILAVLGLSSGMRTLIAARGLLVAACMRDLVLRPGIEPGPPALGAQSLTHWTTGEVPLYFFLTPRNALPSSSFSVLSLGLPPSRCQHTCHSHFTPRSRRFSAKLFQPVISPLSGTHVPFIPALMFFNSALCFVLAKIFA